MDEDDLMGISQNKGVKKSTLSWRNVGIIVAQSRHYRGAMALLSTLYDLLFRVFPILTILTILTHRALALSAVRV